MKGGKKEGKKEEERMEGKKRRKDGWREGSKEEGTSTALVLDFIVSKSSFQKQSQRWAFKENIYLVIYLKVRVKKMEGERDISCNGSLSRWLHLSGLGQAGARS